MTVTSLRDEIFREAVPDDWTNRVDSTTSLRVHIDIKPTEAERMEYVDGRLMSATDSFNHRSVVSIGLEGFRP